MQNIVGAQIVPSVMHLCVYVMFTVYVHSAI